MSNAVVSLYENVTLELALDVWLANCVTKQAAKNDIDNIDAAMMRTLQAFKDTHIVLLNEGFSDIDLVMLQHRALRNLTTSAQA